MTRNSNNNSNNNNNNIINNSNNINNNNNIVIPPIYEPISSSKYNKTYQNLSKHQFTEYEKMFLCECYLNGSQSAIEMTTSKGYCN